MIVALPYFPGDQDQALRLAAWIRELGPYPNHSLLIVRDARCTNADLIRDELRYANFQNVEELVNPTVVDGWPAGANFVFGMTARHIKATNPQPWLFLEPDAIPLRKGWLDALEKEYKEAGKPFMGDLVGVENVPVHYSGVSIYPPDLIAEGAGRALNSYDIAWDVVISETVLLKFHETKQIQHAWKHPPFESWEHVTREVDLENAVLFHAAKDGSLIDLLRKNLSGGTSLVPRGVAVNSLTGIAATTRASDALESSAPPAQIICDILIKSYPKDYEWLSYCLRGLQKFATGFRRIIIIHPINEAGPLNTDLLLQFPVRVLPIQENGDPYLFQQAVKFSAHEWTDAPYILHIDSDTVPCAPFTPETFFRDGKPLWLMTPYSAIQVPWQAPTEKFIGESVEYEYMRRFPILLPRSLHVAAAKFCEMKHGKTATEYIVSQPNREFSEFNALGALAHAASWEFTWLDTTKEPLPPLVAIQSWSHGGLTNELKQKFETILGGDAICLENHTMIPATATSVCHGPQSAINSQPGQSSGTATSKPEAVPGIHQTKENWWVIDGDTHISTWVENEGRLDHDQWMLPRILPEIREGDVVVDAGAFIGDHTIAYLRRGSNVICFEPNPLAAECLRRNVPGVTLYERALSDEDTTYPFEVTPNAGASSVTDKVESLRWTESIGLKIHSTTLDSLKLDRLDFFKLDVEGFELKALKGAEATIMRCRPKMLIEINKYALRRQGAESNQIFQWLKEHDYDWAAVQPLHIADPPQYDIFCRPSKVASNGAKPEIVPWQSPLESQAEVRQLVARLRDFCVGASASRVRFVRQELVLADVIARPKDYSWTVLRKRKNARKRRLASKLEA